MDFKPHISVRDLYVAYGEHAALENINLDIPEKKITAIIGPSGCGKTTLLKSFNLLLQLDDEASISGDIMIRGEHMNTSAVDVTVLRRRMGLLMQKPQVLPMPIYDNVAYGLRINGVTDKKLLNPAVEKHLREAGLWDEVKDRLYTPASKLSIGQQQRLCLARGLAIEPEIILGDEPTSALDPISAERIEKKFLELKDRYTIVLVTHILRQAKRLADYVVFLYLGKLIEYGPAQEVFNNPKDHRTQAYLAGQFIGEETTT